MCSDEQHKEHMAALARIEKALDTLICGRIPQSQSYSISDTQGFHLSHKDRKHVFIYTNTPITLKLDNNTFPVFVQTWTNLDFIAEGSKLFTIGTASPVSVSVCCTDEMIG